MLIGAHMSIAGGLHRALERASRCGFATLAMFVRNQRQWRAGPLTDSAVELFRRTRRKLRIGPVAAHASYLLNLAGSDTVRNLSLAAAADELDRCGRLGLEFYVFHPGSCGELAPQAGAGRLAEGLNALVARCPHRDVKLVLETTAGAGHHLGGSFEDLAAVLEQLSQPERFGVCLDSCHVFAAGCDIRAPQGYAETMDRFDRVFGLSRLMVIHLNDSLGELGSRLDRHAHIGKGKIGLAGFANFVNDPRLDRVPMILETPKGEDSRGRDWDLINANVLRRLRRGG